MDLHNIDNTDNTDNTEDVIEDVIEIDNNIIESPDSNSPTDSPIDSSIEELSVKNISTDNNELYCMNCNKKGHIFKSCTEPVYSYGLLCFYKKKIMVKDNTNYNTPNFFNRKTKKGDNSLKNNKINKFKKINNVPNIYIPNMTNIKILKKNEIISHTLKNMLGIKSNNKDEIDDTHNTQEDIDGVIDTKMDEEIIDVDGEYETVTKRQKNYNCYSLTDLNDSSGSCSGGDNNIQLNMKEITVQKVLLVQRRNTIGMIEFIRGKYDVTNLEYIIKLFNMMTFDEKKILKDYDSFDMIRTLIGLKREFNYRGEYDDAKTKFHILKKNPEGDMVHSLLEKSYTKWTSPEWGVPKGRRNNKEFDIECAIREFAEETGIKYNNINVFRNVKPLSEIYRGVNGVIYKHIYYIAELKDTPEVETNIFNVEKAGYLNGEISNVKLFNLTEVHKIIRPYYMSKLNAIKKGFQIINCLNYYFE